MRSNNRQFQRAGQAIFLEAIDTLCSENTREPGKNGHSICKENIYGILGPSKIVQYSTNIWSAGRGIRRIALPGWKACSVFGFPTRRYSICQQPQHFSCPWWFQSYSRSSVSLPLLRGYLLLSVLTWVQTAPYATLASRSRECMEDARGLSSTMGSCIWRCDRRELSVSTRASNQKLQCG